MPMVTSLSAGGGNVTAKGGGVTRRRGSSRVVPMRGDLHLPSSIKIASSASLAERIDLGLHEELQSSRERFRDSFRLL